MPVSHPDLIIRNAWIIDGSGAAGARGDLLVSGDTIAAMGDVDPHPGCVEIPGDGLALAPGFIDVHSHSDIAALAHPDCDSKTLQGVTTEVVGNCGFSAAPILGACREKVDAIWEDSPVEIDWADVAGYRRRLDRTPPAVNIAMLVGHNNVRASVIGYDDRQPAAEELRRMEELTRTAVAEGALGFSTGLAYSPGIFSRTPEVAALARAACEAGGDIYASHIRSEGDQLLESIDETIAVGEQSGARVQVSHLKASGAANWPKLDDAIARLEAAAARGMKITWDRYPYTASWTGLTNILPAWAFDGGTERLVARVTENETRSRLAEALRASRYQNAWETVIVAGVSEPSMRGLQGRSIAEIAGERGVDPAVCALDILRDDRCRPGAFFVNMDPQNMRRILGDPRCMIASDASARSASPDQQEGLPHPRAFGAFPRAVGNLVRDGLYPLEQAIWKSTGLPADVFRLDGRGRIRPGCAADLLLFDPAALADRATWEQPAQPPAGIRAVWVNGRMVVRDGAVTGERPGRFLPGKGARG